MYLDSQVRGFLHPFLLVPQAEPSPFLRHTGQGMAGIQVQGRD